MEILVSERIAPIQQDSGASTFNAPPNEFVQDFNVLFEFIYVGRILGVKDGERRYRSSVIDVAASWLQKTSDEDNLEQWVCIFEKLESRTCLDEFGGKRVEIAVWNGFKMFVELVSEN